jgi:hypothetical protein
MAMSNLLALPLVAMSIETATNEDWMESICYLVGGTDPALFPQLDLRGIRFDMEVRRQSEDHEVLIRASSSDADSIAIGEAPNYGFLLINVSHKEMLLQHAGSYVADIVGTDEYSVRRCVTMAIEIVDGVTRP